MRVLIVEDGNQRGALAAVRALGSAGAWVGVAAPHKGLAASSRWCRRFHPAPSPAAGERSFLSAVRSAVERSEPDLIFPVGDSELFTLSAAREEIAALLPYADHDVVLRAFDKVELSERARALGLAVPASATSVEGLTALGLPVIVKERLHGAAQGDFSNPPRPVTVARNEAAAASAMSFISDSGGEPFAQRFIQGDLIAVICLLDEDRRELAVIQQRALRTFPPGAGVSTRAQIETPDRQLANKVLTLLRDIGWVGLAELQFLCAEDGEPHLIDLNGRFYGSLALAIAAGADLATAWSRSALGQDASPVEGRIGTRYQWLEGDLRRAATERRGGLVGDVVGSLSFSLGAAHSIWNRRDPVPALRFAARLAARGLAS